MPALKIWKLFYTTIALGGKIGSFAISSNATKTHGILTAKTDEDIEQIKSMKAFADGRIWEVTAEDIERLNAPQETPASEKAGYDTLFSLFSDEENKKISQLPKEALETIKTNILEILDNEFPKPTADAEEKTKEDSVTEGGKKTFAHLKELYNTKRNFNKWISANGLDELWAVYKDAKDIDGFIAKLEEENN